MIDVRIPLSTAVWLSASLCLLGLPVRAPACDICAVYTATEMRESRSGIRLGVSEQLTRYTTLQENGEEVANPNHERLESSITQVVLGYQINPKVGLQLNLPFISRSFRRVESIGVVNSDETGFGDLSLLANALAYSRVDEHSLVRFSLLGGLKLPSGDSHRLAEELTAPQGGGGDHAEDVVAHDLLGSSGFQLQHADEAHLQSGIHGHDLALGSGSVDYIFGGQLFANYRRTFFTGVLQYTARTTGDFEYRYADDLVWSGGPGAYLLLGHDHSLGFQAVVSGETKGKDVQAGARQDDTAITSLYVGPGFNFTWRTNLSGEIAADLPVIEHSSALQIVPDFRLRGAVVWRF